MHRGSLTRLRCTGAVLYPVLLWIATAQLVQGQGQLEVGYAKWVPVEGLPAPAGTALFSFSDAQGTLLWQAGVAAERPLTSGLIFVDQAGRRTALAVVNTGADADRLVLTLRFADGTSLPVLQRDFAPGQQVALFIDELYEALPSNFVGSLEFTGEKGDARWAAVTLRQSTNQFGQPIFATLPVTSGEPSAAASLVFPQIGAGSGLSTQVILLNPFNLEIRGRIRLTASSGEPLQLNLGGVRSDSFEYSIPAKGVFRGQFTLDTGVGVGYAVVDVEQGPGLPAGSAMFQFTSGESTVTEAGVLPAALTRRARIYADQAGTRTGVALARPDSESGPVTLRLLDRQGKVLRAQERTVPADGHLAIFVDELFPGLPTGFTGMLELASDTPLAALTLKLTTNRLGQPVLTTLPVVDLEAEPASGIVYFPQFGFGSGFGTRLILLDSASATGSSGQLSFWRQAGSGLEVPLGGEQAAVFDIELGPGGFRQLYPGVVAEIAEIDVDPAVLILNQGSQKNLNPITLDQQGNPRDDFALDFTSLNPGTVSVTGEGTMTALNRGFSTLVISSGGLVRTFTVVSGTISGGVAGFEPSDVVQDLSGQVFLAGGDGHAILRAGSFESQAAPYAGTLGQAGLVNGSKLQSRFNRPAFLALDLASGGDLYVSDSANHQVRRVQGGIGGEVLTLSGASQPGSQDGIGAQARFNTPQGLALDDRGFLWVADSGNHTIRRIDLATGAVSTIAGTPGAAGLRDGNGSQARFNQPRGLVFEAESLTQQLIREQLGTPPPPVTVLVADSGNGVIRRVREDGKVETIGGGNLAPAGTTGALSRQVTPPYSFDRPAGLALDPFGNLYVSERDSGDVKVLLRNGDLVLAAEPGTFSSPGGMAITIRGRILIAEAERSVQQIRYAGPTLTTLSPDEVPSTGGTRLVLDGANFAPESVVLIGRRVATQVEFVNTTQLVVTTPELDSGLQTITVLHRGGLAQKALAVRPPGVGELATGDITTLAGGTTYTGDGLLAAGARLGNPSGLAVSPNGDVYIVDEGHHRIRRISAVGGTINTVAGLGIPADSGSGIPAVLAALAHPAAAAFDPEGNLVFADRNNHRLRRLEIATGLLETLMGDGNPGSTGDGGPAVSARLNGPAGVAVGPDGTIWISDQGNHRIRRIDPVDGTASTAAGTGSPGSAGDGGPGSAAQFNSPAGLRHGPDGAIHIADRDNHRVRRIDPATGLVTTVAGSGVAGFSGDGGPALTAALSGPEDVAFDSDGRLLIADAGNHRVRRVDPVDGRISTVAGSGAAGLAGDGGPATAANLNGPSALAVAGDGVWYVADSLNRRIRQVDAVSGNITTLSGAGAAPAEGQPAYLATLESPSGLALAGQVLVVAEEAGHRLRGVGSGNGGAWSGQSEDPVVVTLAGDGFAGDLDSDTDPLLARFTGPTGVAVDASGLLLLADTGNHKLRRVSAGGVGTLAGTGEPGYFDDVPANLATFVSPGAVIPDPAGGYLIADTLNHRIRRLDPLGFVGPFAGTGLPGFSGEGGQPDRAQLNQPGAMVTDAEGRIYFCDQANHRIRLIDRAIRQIVTIAGTGDPGFSGDGGPATAARLDTPSGLVLGGSGRLYVADTGNHRIRVIDLATGAIATLAGTGSPGAGGDGGPGTAALLHRPVRLALDEFGNLLVSDQGNHRVRVIRNAEGNGTE